MARCGCSSRCNCLVISGSNITVTGTGSLADPYVITGLAPYTDEMARDAIGAALVAGTGITIAVNDAGDTITISSGASGTGIATTRAVSTSQDLPNTDEVVLASGTINLTLPAVGSYVSRRMTIKNIGTGSVTITPASGTLDGAASKTLNVQYSSVDLVTDGTNWWEI